MDSINIAWRLLLWVPAVVSLILLWSGQSMGSTDLLIALATIAAALIAGIIALVGQWKQLKRDGKTIDKIYGQASDMKPQVEEIQSTVKAIEPSIIRIEDRSSKIDTIAAAVQSFNQMKESAAEKTTSPEKVIAAITSVYDQLVKVTEEKNTLLKENLELRNELERQKALNRSYQKSYNDLER